MNEHSKRELTAIIGAHGFTEVLGVLSSLMIQAITPPLVGFNLVTKAGRDLHDLAMVLDREDRGEKS